MSASVTPTAHCSAPLVSVVIPAYNAATTLAETLATVRGQTYHHLEIVVVDDGSTDRTAAIAAEQACNDSRVRLLRQSNAGVAAARNRGIAETTGPYIAFIDADDLWKRDKVARQVAAIEEAGDDTALCYTWFVNIDTESNVLSHPPPVLFKGNVLEELCRFNFVGNGSSMLVRRTALDRVGGFDSSLRARGAQGCEDYDLLLKLAENDRFALVPDTLVGYRITLNTMSGNKAKMLRSWRFVNEELERRRPDLARPLAQGRIHYAAHLIVGDLLRGKLHPAIAIAQEFGLARWRLLPPLAVAAILRIQQRVTRKAAQTLAVPGRFNGDAP